MKDFSSIRRSEAARRNEEKENIAIKFLARERQRMVFDKSEYIYRETDELYLSSR